MSFLYKCLLIFSVFLLSNSEIEYSSCTDGKRRIVLEDGTIKTFDCIKCEEGFYTIYENNALNCVKCPANSNNYGQDIVIDTFTEKILSRYSPEFIVECDSEDKDKGLCPYWEKNIFSLKIKNIKDNIDSKSILKLNKYYVENGEFQIKYINYNGDINRYLLIYINNDLVYKDDTKHSKEKIRTFKINKGNNKIEIQYIIDKNLSPKEASDIESFFEIYEINMTKAETSSLECQIYDNIDILKDTILNNCNFYINKCNKDDICTSRFYTEKSGGSNIMDGSQTISYNKIKEGNCTELISPTKIEIEAEQCSYGQFRNLTENDKNIYYCAHCPEKSYSNKAINYDFSCQNDCDTTKKVFQKIFYINNFEDQSQFDYNISISKTIAYVEVIYEKYNVKEDSIIFVEIDNINNKTNKTYQLINPNEKTNINDETFLFKIPLIIGEYQLHLKGKNIKIKTIKIINSEEGGNYLCLDRLITKEEIFCNSNKYYSQNYEECTECPNFSFITENSKCSFKEQLISGKFILDNSLLLKHNLFLKDYTIIGKDNNKYHLNLNPTYPLIYKTDSDSNFKIIGNELINMKLVRGINNRGIIFIYYHKENNNKYASYVYIKCNKLKSEGNIEFINESLLGPETLYYFSVESDISCPYCLESEIDEKKTDGICLQNNTELYKIESKSTSACVVKTYENSTSSLIIDNYLQFLLYQNSSYIEDKNLISYFQINENIPIFYEKETDTIVTETQRYKSCEKEEDRTFPAGYIILIVIGSLIVILAIIFIILKARKSSIMKPDVNEIISEMDGKELNLKSISSDY